MTGQPLLHPPGEPQVIGSVEELHHALRIASELEHGLCCQYLFAMFSLKRLPADLGKLPGEITAEDARLLDATQSWAGTILHVARQEMEHLGIVLNLQAATGMPPHLSRPDFPVPQGTYPIDAHFCLEKLDETNLNRFVFYEKPDDVPDAFQDPGCCADDSLTLVEPLALQSHGGLSFHSVQELYQEILNAFFALDPADVFAGDPARQVISTEVQWGAAVDVRAAVYTRETAEQAIQQIVREGEGRLIEPELAAGPDEVAKSHYQHFLDIRKAYLEMGGDSANTTMPVGCNPWPGQRTGCTPVTNPVTRRVMDFFDAGYHLMVAMIRDFFLEYRSYYGFFPPWEPVAKPGALFHAAFFPLMTLLVRPVGEMLCRLPAGDSPDVTAGPAFRLPHDLATSAEHDLDWYLRRLRHLEREARELAGADFPSRGDEHRLAFRRLEQALHRLAINFERLWTGGALGTAGGGIDLADLGRKVAGRARRFWEGLRG